MIRAVSFDVWDCLLVDGSDEPKRAALGFRTKLDARREAFCAEIARHHPQLDGAPAAWAAATAWAETLWHGRSITPGVGERLTEAFRVLGVDATPGFDALVFELENMEVAVPPDPAPGVYRMLEVMARRYPLAIVSDAIVTNGLGLRRILGNLGLLPYFQVCCFSDEVGRSKPATLGYERVCGGLGIAPSELVHVGDRLEKDVTGVRAAGGRGVLYTGVLDRGGAESADAHCAHWHDFAAVLGALD